MVIFGTGIHNDLHNGILPHGTGLFDIIKNRIIRKHAVERAAFQQLHSHDAGQYFQDIHGQHLSVSDHPGADHADLSHTFGTALKQQGP